MTLSAIQSLDEKNNIAKSTILTSDYSTTLNDVPPDVKNDLLQPLQFWVIQNDSLLSNKVNCNTGGFPNLKWNLLETYKTHKVYTSDPSVALKALSLQLGDIVYNRNKKTFLIFYSYNMGRQNTRFLKECNAIIQNENHIEVKYFNMDFLFQ